VIVTVPDCERADRGMDNSRGTLLSDPPFILCQLRPPADILHGDASPSRIGYQLFASVSTEWPSRSGKRRSEPMSAYET